MKPVTQRFVIETERETGTQEVVDRLHDICRLGDNSSIILIDGPIGFSSKDVAICFKKRK